MPKLKPNMPERRKSQKADSLLEDIKTKKQRSGMVRGRLGGNSPSIKKGLMASVAAAELKNTIQSAADISTTPGVVEVAVESVSQKTGYRNAAVRRGKLSTEVRFQYTPAEIMDFDISNPQLSRLLDSGEYVYCDGYIVLNKPECVTKVDGKISLTPAVIASPRDYCIGRTTKIVSSKIGSTIKTRKRYGFIKAKKG